MHLMHWLQGSQPLLIPGSSQVTLYLRWWQISSKCGFLFLIIQLIMVLANSLSDLLP